MPTEAQKRRLKKIRQKAHAKERSAVERKNEKRIGRYENALVFYGISEEEERPPGPLSRLKQALRRK